MATIQDVLQNPIVETTSMNADTVVPTTLPSATSTPAQPVEDRADPDIPDETKKETLGVGVEGEVEVWQGHYSIKNFVGSLLLWGAVTVGWIVLAVTSWTRTAADDRGGLRVLCIMTGIVLGCIWLELMRRILLARFGHYYRLTNRRVFVFTGVFHRGEDQMELLRVQDVFVRQNSLFQRLFSLGSVVLTPNDKHLATIDLMGVNDPQAVMDLVWHHARAERDRRSVKVDQI